MVNCRNPSKPSICLCPIQGGGYSVRQILAAGRMRRRWEAVTTEWTWLDRAIWTCVALECLLSNPRWCSVMAFREFSYLPLSEEESNA